jgi:hypothetical protein
METLLKHLNYHICNLPEKKSWVPKLFVGLLENEKLGDQVATMKKLRETENLYKDFETPEAASKM